MLLKCKTRDILVLYKIIQCSDFLDVIFMKWKRGNSWILTFPETLDGWIMYEWDLFSRLVQKWLNMQQAKSKLLDKNKEVELAPAYESNQFLSDFG